MTYLQFFQGHPLEQHNLLFQCIQNVQKFVTEIQPDVFVTKFVLIERKDDTIRSNLYSISSTNPDDSLFETLLFNFGQRIRAKHPNAQQLFLIADSTTEYTPATITIAGADDQEEICEALMPMKRSLEGAFFSSESEAIILENEQELSKMELALKLRQFWKGFKSTKPTQIMSETQDLNLCLN